MSLPCSVTETISSLGDLNIEGSSKEQIHDFILKCSQNANIFFATTAEKYRHPRQAFFSLEVAVLFAFRQGFFFPTLRSRWAAVSGDIGPNLSS